MLFQYILSMLELQPHRQSSLQTLQCGHWLKSTGVRRKPLSPKPNNLLFSAGETQAGHCMSDGYPWVLINSVAEADPASKRKNRASKSVFCDNC